MNSLNRNLYSIIFVVSFLAGPLCADTFTYRDEDGRERTVEAELYGEGEGLFALLQADGQIKLVPQAAIKTRKAAEGPKPADAETIVNTLQREFGADTLRTNIKPPFVCALVLDSPLTSRLQESRCRSFLKKAADFMKRIESIFKTFCRQVRIDNAPSKYPQVVLIFETDDGFEKYAAKMTGGNGVSTSRIAGFYSALTNFLVLRMSECHTFEVPLHEAIHQQVYNQEVLPRLAPLPVWFNEGIATGFEGNGDRITNGPVKVNSHYARRAARGTSVNWDDVVRGDVAFRGDVFVSDAYTHAWCIHWHLVNHYRKEYAEYVKRLAVKKPLGKNSAAERLREFQSAFGKSPSELQAEFPEKLKLAMKRQRIGFEKEPEAGFTRVQKNSADVSLTAVLQPAGLQVQGKLANISPIRDMAYYVTVETDAGTYADWLLLNVGVRRESKLASQFVRKQMRNGRGGIGRSFRIQVRAAVADSEDAKRWKDGDLPVPVFKR